MKKFGTILIVLSSIMVAIGIFFAFLVGHEKGLVKSMSQIKQAYSGFSVAVIHNYDYNEQLNEKITNFNTETFKEERESYEEIANEYTTSIKTMTANVDLLEKKCNVTYEDLSVNIMCQNYQLLYETMMNAYVKEIKEYNEKITEYNSSGEGSFELYDGVKSEFIDFNKDGKYESTEEETKEETTEVTEEE